VAATTAWHGAALGLVSVAVGIPLGVVAGLWGWRAVAGQLGIGAVDGPQVPLVAVAALVPAVLLAAALTAAAPGWLAARTRPATALRTE
jgi:hypothetical protein